MSKVETVALRIFGRDLTIACPPKEKDNLIKAAALLNEELDNISDKNNALIIAGLTLSNKLLNDDSKSTKKKVLITLNLLKNRESTSKIIFNLNPSKLYFITFWFISQCVNKFEPILLNRWFSTVIVEHYH